MYSRVFFFSFLLCIRAAEISIRLAVANKHMRAKYTYYILENSTSLIRSRPYVTDFTFLYDRAIIIIIIIMFLLQYVVTFKRYVVYIFLN